MKKLYVLACLLFSPALFAATPAETLFNVVNFQAQASREVSNDIVNAVLTIEMTDNDPKKLANSVNEAMGRALKIAQTYKSVKLRSGDYQTYPVYDKNKLIQWRARNELKLESTNTEDVTTLIGKLQDSMQLSRMTFSVSPEARRKIENELITEAITAFKQRAMLISTSFNAKTYKIKECNISSGESTFRPEMAVRSLSASMHEASVSPAVEPGTSTLTINAAGSIVIE
ncbi:SIMPL domain-containing protein [Sulfurirhabdus autotrophica]|uniref:Putative secreted protein n=1 Tax=Sulfurirhabdus autotrophica TaxID=1706046 RepID=A0A4R3XUZ1_9PROT|nr:SIMPL domain-containing protein [Sulfurirhabdus autotrophica]TCV82970.1 putative secreted protein [Sulfurirhabdus autotrophica]